MDNAKSLCCEEEATGSPWNDNAKTLFNCADDDRANSVLRATLSFSTDDNETILRLFEKESSYMPDASYLVSMKEDVGIARSTAMHWIVKVHNFYNFCPLTVALAVNYFDRYLSKHLTKSWKAWMIQLLSVACLSIAAKMEEIVVPLLLDLQIEGVEHIFEAKIIQRMELAVLSSLGWRMSSVTVFSYVNEFLTRLDVSERLCKSLLIRVTELLLGSLSAVDFLEFRPSVVALSAFSCALEEIAPLQSHALYRNLAKSLPFADVNLVDSCARLMEELVADPVLPLMSSSQVFGNPASPVTVADAPDEKDEWPKPIRNRSQRPYSQRPTDVIPMVRSLNPKKRKLGDTLK